jgi:hypothetical protein
MNAFPSGVPEVSTVSGYSFLVAKNSLLVPGFWLLVKEFVFKTAIGNP